MFAWEIRKFVGETIYKNYFEKVLTYKFAPKI